MRNLKNTVRVRQLDYRRWLRQKIDDILGEYD